MSAIMRVLIKLNIKIMKGYEKIKCEMISDIQNGHVT